MVLFAPFAYFEIFKIVNCNTQNLPRTSDLYQNFIYIFPIKRASKQASRPSFGLLACLNQALWLAGLLDYQSSKPSKLSSQLA